MITQPVCPEATWSQHALATCAEMQQFLSRLMGQMVRLGYGEEDIFNVRLGLEEAITNAIHHGHGGDPAKKVRIAYSVTGEQVLIKVQDQGAGFDPTQIADPLAGDNLESEGGRGVFLMRSVMDWVEFNDQGNSVTLCKMRSL